DHVARAGSGAAHQVAADAGIEDDAIECVAQAGRPGRVRANKVALDGVEVAAAAQPDADGAAGRDDVPRPGGRATDRVAPGRGVEYDAFAQVPDRTRPGRVRPDVVAQDAVTAGCGNGHAVLVIPT